MRPLLVHVVSRLVSPFSPSAAWRVYTSVGNGWFPLSQLRVEVLVVTQQPFVKCTLTSSDRRSTRLLEEDGGFGKDCLRAPGNAERRSGHLVGASFKIGQGHFPFQMRLIALRQSTLKHNPHLRPASLTQINSG
jgi:hypothetical protein